MPATPSFETPSENLTQMHFARKVIVTPEMDHVAARGDIDSGPVPSRVPRRRSGRPPGSDRGGRRGGFTTRAGWRRLPRATS